MRGWVHMSLYQQGELLADYQFTVDRSADHWIATVGPDGDLEALRKVLAAEWVAKLPPPPELDGRVLRLIRQFDASRQQDRQDHADLS